MWQDDFDPRRLACSSLELSTLYVLQPRGKGKGRHGLEILMGSKNGVHEMRIFCLSAKLSGKTCNEPTRESMIQDRVECLEPDCQSELASIGAG